MYCEVLAAFEALEAALDRLDEARSDCESIVRAELAEQMDRAAVLLRALHDDDEALKLRNSAEKEVRQAAAVRRDVSTRRPPVATKRVRTSLQARR